MLVVENDDFDIRFFDKHIPKGYLGHSLSFLAVIRLRKADADLLLKPSAIRVAELYILLLLFSTQR